MRFIRAVEGFFEGLRDGMAAQREIEGRTNDRSVFEPMTELFRWIAVIVILAIIVSVPLWVPENNNRLGRTGPGRNTLGESEHSICFIFTHRLLAVPPWPTLCGGQL